MSQEFRTASGGRIDRSKPVSFLSYDMLASASTPSCR